MSPYSVGGQLYGFSRYDYVCVKVCVLIKLPLGINLGDSKASEDTIICSSSYLAA